MRVRTPPRVSPPAASRAPFVPPRRHAPPGPDKALMLRLFANAEARLGCTRIRCRRARNCIAPLRPTLRGPFLPACLADLYDAGEKMALHFHTLETIVRALTHAAESES